MNQVEETAWALLCRFGKARWLMPDGNKVPQLFRTRKWARQWAEKNYGYITHLPRLRRALRNYRMPLAVKVRVVIT